MSKPMKFVDINKFEDEELIIVGGERLNKLRGYVIDEFILLDNLISNFLDLEKQEINENKVALNIKKLFDYIDKYRLKDELSQEILSFKKDFFLLNKFRIFAAHGFFYNDYKGNCFLVNKKTGLLINSKFKKEFDILYLKCWNFLVKMQEELGHFQEEY